MSKTQAVYESLQITNPIKYDVLKELDIINYPLGQEEAEAKKGMTLKQMKVQSQFNHDDVQKTVSRDASLKVTIDQANASSQ